MQQGTRNHTPTASTAMLRELDPGSRLVWAIHGMEQVSGCNSRVSCPSEDGNPVGHPVFPTCLEALALAWIQT